MDWAYALLILTVFGGVLTVGSVEMRAAQVQLATQERQILAAALDDAVAKTIATVSNQIDTRAAITDGPFATIGTVTTPACAGAAVTGALCTGTVTITETATGYTGESALQVTGSPYQQQVINQNVALTPSLQHLEGRAMFRLIVTLNSSIGVGLASRSGTLTLRTQAAPLPNTAPPQYAVLDGFTDAGGNVNGTLAESDVGGVCDPTNAVQNCTASAIDTAAVANGAGAGADDSRLHAELACTDPIFNAGLSTANRCTPTADPTAAPQPADVYQNTPIGTSNTSGTWAP